MCSPIGYVWKSKEKVLSDRNPRWRVDGCCALPRKAVEFWWVFWYNLYSFLHMWAKSRAGRATTLTLKLLSKLGAKIVRQFRKTKHRVQNAICKIGLFFFGTQLLWRVFCSWKCRRQCYTTSWKTTMLIEACSWFFPLPHLHIHKISNRVWA